MKWERSLFVLTMVAALLEGSGPAARASSAPQPATSENREKSGDQQKDEARNERDQTRPKQADESEGASAADLTRTRTKPRPGASHPKPALSPHRRPAKVPTKNHPRTDAPGRLQVPEVTRSKAATSVPNRGTGHRSSAPPFAFSVSGEQFKNPRDPGARLGVSGGPPSTPRGTAAINGTTMKRKP
jgi:hypothetical protein